MTVASMRPIPTKCSSSRYEASWSTSSVGPVPAPESSTIPNGIAVTPNLATVVSDSGNARVVGATATGKQLWTVGRERSLGATTTGGVFDIPRGLTYVDADSTLVVADSLKSQLVKLSVAGKVLETYGLRGSAPGQFNFPTDVASQGDRLVVAEKGNDRVQVVVLESK